MSALRLLKETSVSASTSIFDIQDVFTSDYDVYKVVYNDFSTVGTTQTAIDLRFLETFGGVMTTTSYQYCYLNMKAEDTDTETKNTLTYFDNFFGVIDQSPDNNGGVCYIFNPYSDEDYTWVINQVSHYSNGVFRSYKYAGCFKDTRSVTGFRIFEQSTRPFDSGTVRVYGLRVDS